MTSRLHPSLIEVSSRLPHEHRYLDPASGYLTTVPVNDQGIVEISEELMDKFLTRLGYIPEPEL